MEVITVKEVMTCDVAPGAMFMVKLWSSFAKKIFDGFWPQYLSYPIENAFNKMWLLRLFFPDT